MTEERILRKMDKLIKAVEKLTVTISNEQATDLYQKRNEREANRYTYTERSPDVKSNPPVEQTVVADTEEEITHESLKTLCLKKSKKSDKNKPKIKAILKDLGAGKIKDLKGDDLAKAYEAIGKV